jgi:excisionase family DNA binding protein
MRSLPSREVLTVAEVAEYLVLKVPTVRRFLREGTLRGFKAGGVWRIHRADLEEFARLYHPEGPPTAKLC